MASITDFINIKDMDKLDNLLPKSLMDETAEKFLETLLACMQLKFIISQRYRENIRDFKASYMFMSKDKGVNVNVRFDNGKMQVKEGTDKRANVIIQFKDGKALMKFILGGGNLLEGLLHNEVILIGNWNYMYKFAFMAKHLELALTGKQPM